MNPPDKQVNWEDQVKLYFYEDSDTLTLEELYQVFKARMIDELDTSVSNIIRKLGEE